MRLNALTLPPSPFASSSTRGRTPHAAPGARLHTSAVSCGWTRVLAFLVVRYASNDWTVTRATCSSAWVRDEAGASATAALVRATATWAQSGASAGASHAAAARCRSSRASRAACELSSEGSTSAAASADLRGWTRNRRSLPALAWSSDSTADDAVRIRLKSGT